MCTACAMIGGAIGAIIGIALCYWLYGWYILTCIRKKDENKRKRNRTY